MSDCKTVSPPRLQGHSDCLMWHRGDGVSGRAPLFGSLRSSRSVLSELYMDSAGAPIKAAKTHREEKKMEGYGFET